MSFAFILGMVYLCAISNPWNGVIYLPLYMGGLL